jgi:hypothetical protein
MFRMTMKKSGATCLAVLFALSARAAAQEQAPSNDEFAHSRSRADYPHAGCSGPF